MDNRTIRLSDAIDCLNNLPPMYSSADAIKALSALPAVEGWLPKVGDRVVHVETGWQGVVEGHPSDSGIIWCRFDGIGQFGAAPNLLLPAPPID